MGAVAKELSDTCGLTPHAIPLWVGKGDMSYIWHVIFRQLPTVAPENRTPDITENLVELERLLESMGVSIAPKAKFGLLCYTTYRGLPVEPLEMVRRPPPLNRKSSPCLRTPRSKEEASTRRTKGRQTISGGERFGQWGATPSKETRRREQRGAHP